MSSIDSAMSRATLLIHLGLIMVVVRSADAQSRHLLSTKDVDEEQLGSLNATQYLVQFCNNYCEGYDLVRFIRDLDFTTSPECMACQCDVQCRIYGDCCPDAEGNIVHDPDPPTCLYSGSDLDINSTPGFGIFMVTQCNGGVLGDNVFYPVSSQSTNMSYYNSETADCNNVTDYTPWSLQLECTSGYNGENIEASGFDIVDHLYDNEEDCRHEYTASQRTNPRNCHPMLASSSRVKECNVSGLWMEYDEETETACRIHDYPVADGSVVYGNIFCAICNGIVPSRSPMLSLGGRLPSPITVITQFFRPFKGQDPEQPALECRASEWLDPVKHTCVAIHCSPGKRLEDGECVWSDENVIDDEYTFNVLLKPENSVAVESLAHWNTVQQMFIEDFEKLMSSFRTSIYLFSVGLIEDLETVHPGVYDFPKGVIINCHFIVTNLWNRTDLETKVFNFATGMWLLSFDNKDHVFTALLSNIPMSRVKLKAKYWADPVSGTCCVPVAGKFILKNSHSEISSRVIHVTNELFCPHVKLPKSEYKTEANGWITLENINASISPSDFSVDERKRAKICIDILKEIYNGSYKNRDPFIDIPSYAFAQQILSLFCVTLSLLCLALTLTTYCAFPVLRSLPAKNNMFLMTSLFVAQLLFQFGIDQTENEIVCAVIGVLIHFSWLCVVFWMNVCSFHMLRVFGVHNALPQIRSKHGKTLLKYCIYSFGGSALVIVVTITVNLILSNGSDVGYGGVVCYLASNKLVGFAFALPLSVILAMNLTFFVVTVRAISKIKNIKKHGMKERQNVYVYIKLSSLTGMFWLVAVLAEVFHQDVLVYISIVLNGSLGVLLFLCYTANRRIYDLWKGACDQLRKRPLDESRTVTVSTSA